MHLTARHFSVSKGRLGGSPEENALQAHCLSRPQALAASYSQFSPCPWRCRVMNLASNKHFQQILSERLQEPPLKPCQDMQGPEIIPCLLAPPQLLIRTCFSLFKHPSTSSVSMTRAGIGQGKFPMPSLMTRSVLCVCFSTQHRGGVCRTFGSQNHRKWWFRFAIMICVRKTATYTVFLVHTLLGIPSIQRVPTWPQFGQRNICTSSAICTDNWETNWFYQG